jgi:PAS domain S-box-containing protein
MCEKTAGGLSAGELQTLLEFGSDWLWETDAELRFSWLSDSFAAATGADPSAVLGRFRFDFLKHMSSGSDAAIAHLKDLQERRTFRDFVYELNDSDENCRWIATSGFPRFDSDGNFVGYRGVGRNVTGIAGSLKKLEDADSSAPTAHARQMEAELVRAAERSRQLLSDLERTIDAVEMGIVILDADLNTEIINKAFYTIWKLAPEQAPLGIPFRSLLELDRGEGGEAVSQEAWEAYIEDRIAEVRAGDAAPRELVHVHDRTTIYSVTALSGGKRLISYYDVTELKQALEKAKLAEAVIESVPNPIFVKDADLTYVMANQAFADFFDATPDQVIGKKDEDLVSPEEIGTFDESERRVLDTGELYQSESAYLRDGVEGFRMVRKNRVQTSSGKTYLASSIFDISESRQREKETEQARKYLADVLESLPTAVMIYDRDDNFVFANKKLQDSLPAMLETWNPRHTMREALELGRTCGYFRHSGDKAIDQLYDVDAKAWLDATVARYHLPYSSFERLNPDGRWYQVYDMRTDDGTYIGVRVDITELKNRETALRDSMHQIDLFRHVMDELPVAAFTKADDLTIEFVNKAWCAITGISKEEAVGRTDRELFGTEEGANYSLDDTGVGLKGDMVEVEEPVTHRDGTIRQVMTRKSRLVASDGSVHLVGSSTDITEVKARERALEESMRENEVFRTLIDNVPVSIYAKRSDLRIFYVNKGWCDLTGFSKAEAVGRTDVEIFGADGDAFVQSDLAVLRTGATQEIEEAVNLPDGGVRHQFARKSAMIASDGSLYLIGSTTDITDLKQREAELQEARQRAVLADRAKSEFLANMSHEIRTPMNGVLGMAELLAKSELNPKQKTFTDIIVKSGNALLTIINDILDFSKIDAGQLMLDPAPFRLSEAIEDVATLVSTRAKEKDLELIVRIEPGLDGLFVGDVGRIRQIVTNLVGNAVKFTDDGHVLVDVTGERAVDGTRLHVSVTDTGIGIPEEKRRLIFEKFSQVDASSTRRHEGTGLGLAITSRLVELMGGEIGVESEQGTGSTFWFAVTLPSAEQTARIRITPSDVTGARVLIVDDNAVNRSILTEQMASWRFDSCAASSGAEGLKVLLAAAAYGVPVDCVVLDYQMPGMSGEEMARIMRNTDGLAHTPIVMLTSVDHSLASAECVDLGIDAHLVKPVRSSALLEALVGAIQWHRAKSAPQEAAAAGIEEPTQHGPREQPAGEEPQKAIPHGQQPHLGDTATDAGHQVHILVAEDNEVNQLVFTQILGETGYRFEIVGNGRLALEACARLKPLMILMDVSMPEMNGHEATAEIRRAEAGTGSHVPIVGVTAHALKGDRERCLEAGMDDYLSKPISPKALLEKVERWLENGDEDDRVDMHG